MKNISKISVREITKSLTCSFKIVGCPENKFVTSINSVSSAEMHSLVFIDSASKEKRNLINQTKALLILCDDLAQEFNEFVDRKCFIVVENPRLAFIRVAKKFFSPQFEHTIHSLSTIHPEAKIEKNVFIGAHTYIGNSKINEGSVIYGNCYIYDNVTIGRNVIVHAGTIIGVPGLGHVKNENNEWEVFPQIGGVVIEDDVEIGANCTIDRGTFNDTIVRKGTKMSNLVYVGHNSVIGEHCLIAFSFFAGSTKIGQHSYIAPSVSTIKGVSIGKNTFVGAGSLITKDIPDNETWVGVPARPIKDFEVLQKKQKEILLKADAKKEINK